MTGRDTAAAFKGLVIGAIALAIIVVAIVRWTNTQFAGHEGTTPAAESH
jgi:hypothetical protein